MKEVVSVSLGSSSRDHIAETEFLGEKFKIQRIGTDGDFKKAIRTLKTLDGSVDAIGLGGIDLYFWAGGKRYPVRDGLKLQRAVRRTPVVDGSGLKNTLEREAVRYLVNEAGLDLSGKRVLMVAAVDRFGLAEALVEQGCRMTFGDLVFGLGLPFPMRSFSTFVAVAKILLPVVTRMPFKILYPTGSKQDQEPAKKYRKYYEDADIVAGDYHLIRKYMPAEMAGKWVITNTVTEEDVRMMRQRGVAKLVVTTPNLEGRSFGTNVMEATLVSMVEKPWADVVPDDYSELIKKLDLKPRIEDLAV
ncbi:MAG: quinate 5-dehydrogenase [Terriglobia bacterium]